MPGSDAGTLEGHFNPVVWYKRVVDLPLKSEFGSAPIGGTWGTANSGYVYGLVFTPKAILQHTNFATPVLADWDGTSLFVFRYQWFQKNYGSEKEATAIFNFDHWVAQDWDSVLGSKSVTQSATFVYGDEGTTSLCMHCGTFEMDLTASGTFATVAPGHTLFMTLSSPQNVAALATCCVFRTSVEYMARWIGPANANPLTLDKRGG